MIKELDTWLSGIVAPARRLQLIQAFNSLHVQNGTVVEDALSRFMSSLGKVPESDSIIFLEKDTIELLVNAISVYGVRINKEQLSTQDIDELTAILSTLQQLPDYEDYRALEMIFNMAGDSIEIMSELVELVAGVDSGVVMPYFESVSDALILKIKSVIQPKIDEFNAKLDEEEMKHSDEVRAKLAERRDAMFHFIEQITLGDDEKKRVLKTIAGRFASYPPDELFDRCYNTIQNSKNITINQQANMWCLILFLVRFLDIEIGIEGNDRYAELKGYLNQVYDEPNTLFSLSTRIDSIMKMFDVEETQDGTP